MWEQRYVFYAVDVYAWGRRLDDIHARQNVRLAIFVHASGAALICISGSQADDFSVLELRRLLAETSCRRPSSRVLTYRNAVAGLNISFPDGDSLECFRDFTTLFCHTPVPSSSSLPSFSGDLFRAVEEDITTAYHRSFGAPRPYESWDYLFDDEDLDAYVDAHAASCNSSGPSLLLSPPSHMGASCVDVDWPVEDDDSGWDIASQASAEGSSDAEFYDAVESPECSWFELD
ncbi:hypothetical protein ACG7TL_005847 [Trametes sanguinea]